MSNNDFGESQVSVKDGSAQAAARKSDIPGFDMPKWRLYILFAIVVFGAAFGNLSQTAVNAMLTDIMKDMSVSVDYGSWLTTGYMLVLGISVPFATYLSRRLSMRTQVLTGIIVFMVGTLMDFVTPNFVIMFAGRILQAIAVSVLLLVTQTLPMTHFPRGKQGTAMGISGIALGFAPNVGPTVGGALDYAFGWRSFFVLLFACLIVLLVLTLLFVQKGDALNPDSRFETVSFVYSTLGFGGILLGVSEMSSVGLASALVWGPLAVGIVFLVLFVRRSHRVDEPLINLEIFKNKRFNIGVVVSILLYASFLGVTLIIPLTVVNLCGGTTLDAGMVTLPAAFVALIMNPLSGRPTDAFGVRPVVLVTGAFMMVGALLWTTVDESTPLWLMAVFQTLRTIGVSGLIAPYTSWGLAKLDLKFMADGSSTYLVIRQVSASLGTAFMVLALTGMLGYATSIGTPALAYQVSFGVSAVFAIALYIYTVAKVR